MGKARTMDIQALVDAIDGSFPEMAVTSIELAGEGMDNLAYLVNGEYVFRFPKFDEVSAAIELEAGLLPALQQVVEVRIPAPEFVGIDARTGRHFSGYRRIEGAPLDPAVFLGLDSRSQRSLTEGIAAFVRQLHSFSIERSGRLGVGTSDFKAVYAGALERVGELVLPRAGPAERRYVEQLYADYLCQSISDRFGPDSVIGLDGNPQKNWPDLPDEREDAHGRARSRRPPAGNRWRSRVGPRWPLRSAAASSRGAPARGSGIVLFAQDVAHAGQERRGPDRRQRLGPLSEWPVCSRPLNGRFGCPPRS